MKTTRIIFSFFLLIIAVSAHSQNCDKFYQEGVSKQAVMTVTSQNAAIAAFNKAMACYDSAQKKKLCRSQISKCKQNIAAINNPDRPADEKYSEGLKYQKIMTLDGQNTAISFFSQAKQLYSSKQKKTQCDRQMNLCKSNIVKISEANKDTEPQPEQEKPVVNITKLMASEDTLIAKGKGEVLSVDIVCYIVDEDGNKIEESAEWKIGSSPEWIVVTSNPTKIVLDISKLPKKVKERTGEVIITSGDVSKSIIVQQEKKPIIPFKMTIKKI